MPRSFVVLAIVLGLCAATPANAAAKTGARAADFERKSLAGKTVKLSSLRGKIVLVDFWASWCEPCKKELPQLAKMVERLRAKQIEIVTISIDDRRENADAFVRTNGLDPLTVVHDADKSLVDTYEPGAMPTSFVVDREGVVRAVNAGFEPGDGAKLERQLLELAAR